jgi:hypothetical protein
MTMFFHGCGAAYIADSTMATTVPIDKVGLDSKLVWAIYLHIHNDYKVLIEDKKSGLAAWRTLKARFEKSTMSRCLKARSDFYRAVHDPLLNVDIYINKVKAAQKTLKGLGCEPGEVETTDVLLINLHPSWAGVRTTITSNKDEQKLTDVVGILNGSTVDPPVKDEDDKPASLAMAAIHRCFGSGGRRVVLVVETDTAVEVRVAVVVAPLTFLLRMTKAIIGATPPTKITVISAVDPVILQCNAFTTCLSISRIG